MGLVQLHVVYMRWAGKTNKAKCNIITKRIKFVWQTTLKIYYFFSDRQISEIFLFKDLFRKCSFIIINRFIPGMLDDPSS